MADKDKLGGIGEQLAVARLMQDGYAILHTNWQYGHKELDITARKGGELHIVEVKTRNAETGETPAEAVSRRKQKNIIDAAEAYINEFDITADVYFDVIYITYHNGNLNSYEHITDAFTAYD